MRNITTDRGFQIVVHDGYPSERHRGPCHLVAESSAIGEYEDSLKKPGSSFLWVGEHHHLNREEVRQLVGYLERWLQGERLFDREAKGEGSP